MSIPPPDRFAHGIALILSSAHTNCTRMPANDTKNKMHTYIWTLGKLSIPPITGELQLGRGQ